MIKKALCRRVVLGVCLVGPFLLAGCSGPSAPESYPPLRYSYLPPIQLRVQSIRVEDRYQPIADANTLDNLCPDPPVDALEAMAHDRLVAAGSGGVADFVITDASLRHVGDNVVGTLSVRLEVRTFDGSRVGYAEASVSRATTAPGGMSPSALRPVLYSMTKQLMNSMNTEFQYQVQRTLSGWLVNNPSATFVQPNNFERPSMGSAIQQQSLPPPTPLPPSEH